MKTSDFDYHLPDESIAQTPVEPRDSSRLLVLDRKTGDVTHRVFRDIGDYLNPGDLLVLNQTRVIPARLYANKPTGGRVEILLLKREDLFTWECLVGGKGLSLGKRVAVENGPDAEILTVLEGSRRLIKFSEPIEPFFPKRVMSRFRRISTRLSLTLSAIKLSMLGNRDPLLRPPQDCTSRLDCWRNCWPRVCELRMSRCMLAWIRLRL
jgi:hypothetical protein